MTEQICRTCEIPKPLNTDNFFAHPKYSTGFQKECKVCVKLRKDKRHAANPLARVGTMLKYNYGMTLEEYLKLANAQNNCCAICEQPPKDGKRLVVDHCHKTGKVRSLLCVRCNAALGYIEDNELLQRLQAYVLLHTV